MNSDENSPLIIRYYSFRERSAGYEGGDLVFREASRTCARVWTAQNPFWNQLILDWISGDLSWNALCVRLDSCVLRLVSPLSGFDVNDVLKEMFKNSP